MSWNRSNSSSTEGEEIPSKNTLVGQMNAIRKSIIDNIKRKLASAFLPSNFDEESITVEFSMCPNPHDAVMIDQNSMLAYCQHQRKVCPQMQLAHPDKNRILCRAAKPYNVTDNE